MNLVPENLSESIKHLKGRSEEEIRSLINAKVLFWDTYFYPSQSDYMIKEIKKRNLYNNYLYFIELMNHYKTISAKRIRELIRKSIKYKINESIKHLKGRSEEELRSSLKNLTLKQKLAIGIENNLDWLVKEAIKEGDDVNVFHNFTWIYNADPLNIAILMGNYFIIKILLDAGAYVTNHDIQIATKRGQSKILRLLKEYERKSIN